MKAIVVIVRIKPRVIEVESKIINPNKTKIGRLYLNNMLIGSLLLALMKSDLLFAPFTQTFNN